MRPRRFPAPAALLLLAALALLAACDHVQALLTPDSRAALAADGLKCVVASADGTARFGAGAMMSVAVDARGEAQWTPAAEFVVRCELVLYSLVCDFDKADDGRYCLPPVAYDVRLPAGPPPAPPTAAAEARLTALACAAAGRACP